MQSESNPNEIDTIYVHVSSEYGEFIIKDWCEEESDRIYYVTNKTLDISKNMHACEVYDLLIKYIKHEAIPKGHEYSYPSKHPSEKTLEMFADY